jgi:hypothetical protein
MSPNISYGKPVHTAEMGEEVKEGRKGGRKRVSE